MRKRVYIALAVLLVILAGVVAWQVLRLREPVYQGKRLSVWLEHLERLDEAATRGNQNERDDAEQAIRHIGTNALPILIERLPAQNTRLKQLMMAWANKHERFPLHFKSAEQRRIEAVCGYEALGSLASAQVPRLIDILDNDLFLDARQAAARVLGYIGPEARLAVPALFRATKDTDDSVRINALWALGEIRPDPQLTIPVLVVGLDDAEPFVRENAALALRRYGPEARAAVPALLRTLDTTNAVGMEQQRFHATVRSALKNIDPEAAAKAGVK